MPQFASAFGPILDWGPVPVISAPIPDIVLTHLGPPGPVLLRAAVTFEDVAAGERIAICICRNAVIPDGADLAVIEIPVAAPRLTLYVAAVVPDSQPGDIYTVEAQASLNIAQITSNDAALYFVGVPANNALAPQAITTP